MGTETPNFRQAQPAITAAFAVTLLFGTTAYGHADEKSARLDDDFARQSAGQVALAIQAQQCDLRSSVWLNKLIKAVKHRLAEHFKEVRPTWADVDNESIAGQILYGAIYGAKGDIGAPPVDSNDLTKMGEQTLSKSMTCQVIEYRKTDILYLDEITDGEGS